MCFNEKTWRFKRYPKHVTPAVYRDRPISDIDTITKNSDSLYYPQHDPKTIEETVLREGEYVRSPKSQTVYKVNEFDSVVGASKGLPSKWVKVESTNGEFHGRPIAEDEYRRFKTRIIPCCK